MSDPAREFLQARLLLRRCAPPDGPAGATPRRAAGRAARSACSPARPMRRASCSTRCAMATRSGVTAAAAAVGVGARRSATKSQMVKSVSCPTPDTTGSADSNTARATTSSLNAHRSSIEPPPRPTISTSTSARVVGGADRLRDVRRGAVALHGGRDRGRRGGGPAAAQRRQDVAQCGGARRRHDADGARIEAGRALARRGEPAGRLELGLQLREFLVQRADARETHVLDVELEFAARLVDRRRRAHLHLQAVAQRERDVLRLLAEEHAAHLRLRVLQVEVAMAGRGAREIRNLAADPDQAQVPFDDEPRRRHEQ